MTPMHGDDPGRLRRRALSFPLTLFAAALVLGSLPLTLPLIALVDLGRGRRFAWTRALALIAWVLCCECWGLLALGALWLAKPMIGGERFIAGNYRLQGAWTGALLRGMLTIQSMELEVTGGEAAATGPLLLLVRHASTGDTLLPMAAVAVAHGLRPRHVLKEELRWDPCLDVVGHRIPNAFVRRGGGQREVERSAALAEGLGPRDLVVIYPEGTRFSPRARERRLAELRAREDPLLGEARALVHTIAPRSGGVLAILNRAPDLDVAFLAHVGLERVRTLADLVGGRLIGRRVQVMIWRVPAAAIPKADADRRRWLFAEWARIDRWIDDQLTE